MVELAMVELCFRSRPSDIFETRHAATQSVTAAKGLSRAVEPEALADSTAGNRLAPQAQVVCFCRSPDC